MYINCKTWFSFCYGTFRTKELVEKAAELGVSSLALTNINNTCDAWDFLRFAREAGIHPVLGTEIRNGDELLYILLAANNPGLQWIHEFLSKHLLEKTDFPKATDAGVFFARPGDGFVVLPLHGKPLDQLRDNERVGIKAWELNQLYAVDVAKYKDKWVIWQPVTVQDRVHFNVHRLLRAVDNNTLLSKLPTTTQADAQEVFTAPHDLLKAFHQYPFMVTNTLLLLESCQVHMDFHTDKNKRAFSLSPKDDKKLLEKLARDGFLSRYGKKNKPALERLEKELAIINDMGFNAYFLVNHEIVRYAQMRGFYHVGRGSGANSIVAYCLRITDVDPIELNLYFERFLNPERTSPPDFDIDFSWTDRDEIMDYIFTRYGNGHVALLGAYPTFQHDAIIRQLGKVFGIPDEEIKTLQRATVAEDKIHRQILQYGRLIRDFPSHPSIHPCGMLITEQPIAAYAPVFMPPKGFPTVLMDMFVAEDIGVNKYDILSQRGLGHIRESLRLVKENKNIDVDIHAFKKFREDPKIKMQIREGNTIGCFYIESPAMRQLLKKLRCDDYPTLVAASSIIRPGVAESGMMREYIFRYHNRDKVVYLHPLFEEHLSETFGVMVFQEDVIKIGHYFAGLKLGEADVLRRAMSGKYRSTNQFKLVKEKFFANCKELGHPDALAAEVWRQMESFAGYSFNKAHSASFAVESYMSLYLKTYFPKEFIVAVINNFGGFYSRELYFMELLKTGAQIEAPCINRSQHYTSIETDTVFTGFIHIKGLQEKLLEKVLEDRKLNGPYTHLQDFIERTGAGIEQLNTLISVGAFRFTGKSKKTLLWEANFLQKQHQPEHATRNALFEEPPLEFELPVLIDYHLDDLYDQMEIMGFTLTNPFELVEDEGAGTVAAIDLEKHLGQTVTVLVYFIARKHVTTKYNDQMFFGTFVDRSLDWIDTVHFPEQAKNYPLHTGGFYRITGKVVEDFGVCSLEVAYMKRIGYKHRSYAGL